MSFRRADESIVRHLNDDEWSLLEIVLQLNHE